MSVKLELPSAQIDFAHSLKEIRCMYLQEALVAAVSSMDVATVDTELHTFVGNDFLQILASRGMRGELLFAVPAVLEVNPRLLGYYRLLLGYSQKGFYTAATGAGMFKSLEEKGALSLRQRDTLPALCKALNISAKFMLENLEREMISATFFDQLTLLTLGPQLRGGANVRKGSSAITQVFDVVFHIVSEAVTRSTPHCIEVQNKSGRTVLIEFAADPDIVIREELAPNVYKNQVAIEVKGGEDYSNIHNRVGEAEKSHQKAKKSGYVECWTVVNVDRMDMEMARKESPTTNRFYHISSLLNQASEGYQDFSLQIRSIVGI